MTDPIDNVRRNIAKHGIPTGTDDPVLLSLGAKPLSPHDARTEHHTPEQSTALLQAELDAYRQEIARLRTSLAQANRTIADLQEHR